jgi:hypothetical protein
MPVTFTAVPPIGQAFAYWVISNGVTSLSSKGSVWRYQVPATEIAGWNQTAFNDAAWASGAGQLGYGDSDESTVIGAASNLITSAYFRRTVVVNNAATISSLDLQLLRDDGAIVYLNGAEILRSNMPAGAVSFATFASSNITSSSVPNENAYNPFVIAPVSLLEGTNVLAVEIHQSSENYTDLGFDLQATATRASSGVTTNTSPVLTFVPDSATPLSVTAVFAPTGASLLPSVVNGNLTLTAAGSPWLATGDIYVPSNTCLTAEPGVTIHMPAAASIYVQGELRLAGTADAPVCILPNTNDNARARLYVDPALSVGSELEQRWGGIGFNYADHTGILSNVVIRGASLTHADAVNFKGAINALGSDLYMDGLDVDDVHYPIFVQNGRSTVLCNSRLHISVVGDIINIKRAQYARVENNDFRGCDQPDTDAVDYDGVRGGIIRNNHIYDFVGFNSDGVDIGEEAKDLLIEGNVIENCFDKGISIGQDSTVTARRNIIQNVDMGFGIKDAGSHGLIENCTFRNLSHAVSVYEKNLGDGGGSADVRNCIVSHATIAPFFCDSLSTLNVSYTLSDSEPVPGTGNLLAEPQFEHPGAGNFRLQTGSAAVDSGAPDAPLDPDGSRADMGAFAFDWRLGHAVISEIFYHPSDSNAVEFVELTNPGGQPLDLTGFRFDKGITFEFPSGTLLHPDECLVIAAQPEIPGATNVLAWTAGTLDNAGETLQLVDAATNEIDRVAYSPLAPWPTEADGQGPSLALFNPRWDNALAASWYASATAGGTPGQPFDNPAVMPSNRVVVTSSYGLALPPTGTNWYSYASPLTASVTNSPLVFGATQLVCTGWAGSGSAPAEGSTTSTPPFLLKTDAAITWNWGTNYWLTTSATAGGTVSVPASWCAKGSNVLIRATASAHYHFTGWSGQTNGCAVNGADLTAAMTQPRAVAANFTVDQHSLIIATPLGKGLPPPGTYLYNDGATVSASITNSPITMNAWTQQVCVGWSGTGSAPASGAATNTGPVLLTENTSITWLWATNFWMNTSVSSGGTLSEGDGWYRRGSNVLVRAIPALGYRFAGWSGQTNGCTVSGADIQVLMDRPRDTITATFSLQYSIQITSPYGQGTPPIGTNWVDPSTTQKAAITNSPVTVGTTQYVCRGWTGSGSVVSSGSTTNTPSFKMIKNTTVDWLWRTNYWLDVSYTGQGTLSTNDSWLAKDSALQVTATPSAHWHFSTWAGQTNGCTLASNKITVATDRARAIGAVFQLDQHRLTVTTPHGVASPSSGTNWLDYATPLSVAITNAPVFEGTTQYVCKGWTGTGSAPKSGITTNTGLFTLTNDSAVAWSWQTNYWLNTDVEGGGTLSVADDWQARNTNILVVATASNYWSFSAWKGTTNGCTIASNRITVAMSGPRQITAVLLPALATNNVPKWWLSQFGLTNFNQSALQDADHDGLLSWQEWVAGTDPTNPASFFQFKAASVAAPTGSVLRWASVPNRFYALTRSTNLSQGADGFRLLTAATNLPATPPENIYTDRVDGAGPFFYRLRVSE